MRLAGRAEAGCGAEEAAVDCRRALGGGGSNETRFLAVAEEPVIPVIVGVDFDRMMPLPLGRLLLLPAAGVFGVYAEDVAAVVKLVLVRDLGKAEFV